MHCMWTAGLLSAPPVLFALPPATVTETECQARGGERCLYTIAWDAERAAAAANPAEQITALEAQLKGMSERLESVYATVTDLVSPEDDEGEEVTEGLGEAVAVTVAVTVTVTRAAGLRPAFAPFPPPHAESASTVANAAPVIRSDAQRVRPTPLTAIVSRLMAARRTVRQAVRQTAAGGSPGRQGPPRR